MILGKSERRLSAAKTAWGIYAMLGSLLFVWDLSATREHILGSLIVAAYSFPSSMIAYWVATPFVVGDVPQVVSWLAMVLLNGGLVFAAVYFLPGGKSKNA